MSRYIVLDIDEVLNSVHFRIMNHPVDDMIDSHALELFNYVANALNCKVILNSTWRLNYKNHFFEDEQESLKFYQHFFRRLGASFTLIGVTSFHERGMDKGALRYIQEHAIDARQVLVLDDSIDGDYPLAYVAPNGFTGFSIHDMASIFKYFDPSHEWYRTYYDYMSYNKSTTSFVVDMSR